MLLRTSRYFQAFPRKASSWKPRRRLRARSRQGGPGSDKCPFGDGAPSCTEWLHIFAAQVYRLPRSKNKQEVCLRSCRDACVVGGSRRDPKHVRWWHALDPQTHSFMEERFRTDFGKVRIHTGLQAARLSSNLNAIAFTVGNSIMFAEGKYSPDSQAGRQLLAHKLTHVVQQQGAELHSIQRAKTDTTNSCSGLADSMSDVNSRINKALANAHKAAGASLPVQMWHRNFMQSWLKIPLRAQGEDRAMGRGIGRIKSAPSGPKFNQVCRRDISSVEQSLISDTQSDNACERSLYWKRQVGSLFATGLRVFL